MKFSVIIPVYNSKDYLYRCLDSICNQKGVLYEVICVNDGSTDGSIYVLQEYKNRYPYIEIYSQENQGPSSARNLGIKVAKGDYILFCDSDDWFERDTILLELSDYIETEKGVDLVYFPGNTNWGGNKTISPNYKKETFDTGWKLCSRYCLKESHLFFGSPVAFCYRKDLLISNKIKFEINIKYGEDRLWVFDVLDKANLSIVYPYPCYFYNIRPNSLMTNTSNNRQKIIDAVNVSELLWKRKWVNKKTLRIKKYITRFQLANVRSLLSNGLEYKTKLKDRLKLFYTVNTIPQFVKVCILVLSPNIYKKICI